MGGLTRKELLAGAAAAGVVAGCGGVIGQARLRPARLGVGQGAVRALARRPPLRRLRPRHAPEAGPRGDRAPPARARRRPRRLHPRARARARRARARGGRAIPRGPAGLRVHRLDDDGPRPRLRRHPDRGPPGRHRARLLLDARVAAPALQGLRADPALRRPGAGHRERDGRASAAASTRACSRSRGCTRGPASRSPRRRSPKRCDAALVVLDGVHGLGRRRPADRLGRRARRRHAQVARRPARHRPGLEPGLGPPDSRSSRRSTPALPASNWNPGGYHTFEHRWALAEAFDFHHRIGRTKVTKRIQSLATRLKQGLAELRATCGS